MCILVEKDSIIRKVLELFVKIESIRLLCNNPILLRRCRDLVEIIVDNYL